MEMEFITPDVSSDIVSVLRRRGLTPEGTGSTLYTLYPEEQIIPILKRHGQFKYHEYFPPPLHISDYYLSYFGQNKFRKMVRRLLRDGRQFVPLEEISRIAGSRTDAYIDFLGRLLLLEQRDNVVRLTRNIPDLGASLEHYVAETCIRELCGSAAWGVLLPNLPRADSGGDFDVLSWLEPSLVYVECKTSPPSNIDESAIREFLQRSVELAPDLAILLIDTEDDLAPFIREKINPILHEKTGSPGLCLQTDYPRVFFGFFRVYVINARKTILGQLQRCLQHYYARVKGVAVWGLDQQSNFTRRPVRDEG